MIKKIITAILCVFMALTFCGCSSITYTVAQTPNGAVIQNISISIDSSALNKAGISYDYVVSCVQDEINDVVNSMIDLAGQKGVQTYNMSSFPQGLISGMGYSYAHITTSGEISGRLNYDSYNIYCQVHDIDPSEEIENEIEYGIFVDREILARGTLIFSSETAQTIYQNVQAKILAQYPNCTYNFADTECYYSYAVPLSYAKVKRIKSNATYVQDEQYSANESLRYFVWQYNHNNPNFEMVLYRNILHTWAWYSFAILLTGLFMLAMFIVYRVKKRKNTNEQNEIQLSI